MVAISNKISKFLYQIFSIIVILPYHMLDSNILRELWIDLIDKLNLILEMMVQKFENKINHFDINKFHLKLLNDFFQSNLS